jgi:serine/threonine protein kinase
VVLQKARLCHRSISVDTILVSPENGWCVISGLDHVLLVPTTTTEKSEQVLHQLTAQPPPSTIPAFVAPEMFVSDGRPFDGYAVDIWSAGVVLFTILFHKDAVFVAPTDDDKRFREICLRHNFKSLLHQLQLRQDEQQRQQRPGSLSPAPGELRSNILQSTVMAPPSFVATESSASVATLDWSQLPQPLPELSDNVIDLLQGMLCADPMERYTLSQIVSHPWFTQSMEDVGVLAGSMAELENASFSMD